MSGPIVRTGTTPKFWENYDRVFGGKKKPTDKVTVTVGGMEVTVTAKKAAKKATKKTAKKAAKKAVKKTAKKA
jgi:hypothetical protein